MPAGALGVVYTKSSPRSVVSPKATLNFWTWTNINHSFPFLGEVSSLKVPGAYGVSKNYRHCPRHPVPELWQKLLIQNLLPSVGTLLWKSTQGQIRFQGCVFASNPVNLRQPVLVENAL